MKKTSKFYPLLAVTACLFLFFVAGAAPASSRPQAAALSQGRMDPPLYLPFIANVNAIGYDWLQFGGDPQHSGNNTQETILNASNVHNLVELFFDPLPSAPDGTPVYLHSVNTASGVRDLVYLATRAGHIIAMDAHTGATIWSHLNANSSCLINNIQFPCYTTASPVIDPNRQFVYSYGLDGKVHKYEAGTGNEVTSGGWPELATTKGYDEKGSSDLSFATASNGATYLYVTNSGYPGDAGDYQGHVTAINLADGTQHVFNAMCSNLTVHLTATSPDCPDVQSAIWARPGVIYDSGTDRIYISTGNGTFNPANHYWGDTVFAIHPDGTGSNGNPLDTYTPTNYAQLQGSDLDLGSTAPAILPVPPGSTVQHLAVQSGKDGMLRLLNLDNLSGQGGPGNTGGEVGPIINVPQGGEVLTQPAVWVNPADGTTWVFVSNNSGISGLQLSLGAGGVPKLTSKWQNATGGGSPVVANGVLFYFTGQTLALNPTNGSQLWAGPNIGQVHWESPIVANGVVYVPFEQWGFVAYGLP